VSVTLYGTAPSNPSQAARLMLEHKGIDHEVVWLLPGLHPQLVRLRGFRGNTVPALKLDGRKVQNSREISRALEEAQPEPRLFPADPGERIAVEEAERWGEEELQNVPRIIYRWMAAHNQQMRTAVAREVGIPLPAVAAAVNIPVARRLSRKAGGSEEDVREAIASLPAMLDHVDQLIADGVIGGEQPNAADFQIAPSVRILLGMEDTAPLVRGRPCAGWAMRWLPEMPVETSSYLPPEWLEPVSG
jgi:glutathione S-transferase